MADELPPLPKPDLGSILVGRETISLGHSDEAMRTYAQEAVLQERNRFARAFAYSVQPTSAVYLPEARSSATGEKG